MSPKLLPMLASIGLTSIASAQISFQAATNYPLVGLRPSDVATGDFDGINGNDFAVSTGDLQGTGGGPDRVEIFLNQGNGTFVNAQALVVGNNVETDALISADLDLDGDIDLAVTLKNTNAVRVLFNNGGVFALGGSTAVGGISPENMDAADVDGDGDIDLVTSNRDSNNLSVLRNDGAGVFTLAGTVPVELEPRHLALADFNGDCRTDVAVAAHDSRRLDILFNQGGGTFGGMLSLTIAGNERPAGVVAADLDADGDIDIATTTDNNDVGIVVVLRNSGTGTFTGQTFQTGGANPDDIVAGDLDGDGDKDLATADEDSNLISVLANTGTGSFAAGVTFPIGAHPEGIAAADFTGNGSLELVASNRDTNNVSVLINNTSGGTSNFCVTAPNSAGFGTRIDSTGSVSIAANSFTLLARCAPSNGTGLFFYGSTRAFAPFGNGWRCVGAPVVRLGPPLAIDANGRVSRPVNFTQSPANAIPAGATRYFQFWHRDIAGGGAQFNLSDGLSATFRP